VSRRSVVRFTLAVLLCQGAGATPALAQAVDLPPLDDFSRAPYTSDLAGPALSHQTLNLACGPAQTTVTVTYTDKSGVLPVVQARLDGPDGGRVETDLPRLDGSRIVSRHQGAVTVPAVGIWTLTTTGTDEQGNADPYEHYSTLSVIDNPDLPCPPTAVRYALSRTSGTVSWTNPTAGTAVRYRVEDSRGSVYVEQVPADSASADVSDGVPDYVYMQWRVVPIAADGTEGTPSSWSNQVRRDGNGLGPARVGGVDRYDTAAGLSSTYRYFAQYEGGHWDGFGTAGTLYLATGLAHADALGAGPAAAAAGGPVLLSPRDGLNVVVRSVLDRMNPERIVVVGGPQAVSDSVLAELAPYAPRIDRVAGTDRYATAAAVALDAFTPEDGQRTPVVFVADGIGFADALSGGAVAAGKGAPMLLTAPGALPAATASALAALRPDKIVVLGGESAVSSAVADELASYVSAPVQRVAGTDRYDTSAKIAQEFLPTAGSVYLASGASFPDALASVPVAGLNRAALLLSRKDCLPRAVKAELVRLAPTQDPWIVGGTAALSQEMAEGLVCP